MRREGAPPLPPPLPLPLPLLRSSRVFDLPLPPGRSAGFVTCTEIVDATDTMGRIVATNVFEKQGGKWKIVHHHGSPAPPPLPS